MGLHTENQLALFQLVQWKSQEILRKIFHCLDVAFTKVHLSQMTTDEGLQ